MTSEDQARKAFWQFHNSIQLWVDGPEKWKNSGLTKQYSSYDVWLDYASAQIPQLKYLADKGNKDWSVIQLNLVEYYETSERESWWRRFWTMLGR